MSKSDYDWFIKAGKNYIKEEMNEEWINLIQEYEKDPDYLHELLKYLIPLADQGEAMISLVARDFYKEHLSIKNIEVEEGKFPIEMAYQIARFTKQGEKFLEHLLSLLGENHAFRNELAFKRDEIKDRNELLNRGYSLNEAEKMASFSTGHIVERASLDHPLIRDKDGYFSGISEKSKLIIGREFFRHSKDGIEQLCIVFEIDPNEEKSRFYASRQYGIGYLDCGYQLGVEENSIPIYKKSPFYFMESARGLEQVIDIYQSVLKLWEIVPVYLLEEALNAFHACHTYEEFVGKCGGKTAKELLKKI